MSLRVNRGGGADPDAGQIAAAGGLVDLSWGDSVAYSAQKGEAYQLQKVDQWRWRNKWMIQKFYKKALSQFKKRYEGPPWVDAYIEKMNTVKEEPLEETPAEAAPAEAEKK